MDDALYKEYILDLYRRPLNKGVPTHYDVTHRDFNSSCGDDVTLYLGFNDAGLVSDVGHEGVGCAVSQAAVSLLTEHTKGKTREELRALSDDEMVSMLGISLSHTRMKCALIGLQTLRQALGR